MAESQNVGRTLRALELLSSGTVSQPELARSLGVHPRTAQRLLSQLILEGYAARTSKSQGRAEYAATLKVVALAGGVIGGLDVVRVAAPYVTELSELTQEAAHLSIPAERGVIHVIQETGSSLVTVRPRLGEHVPYHSTAVGKALLAHLPGHVTRILDDGLQRFTKYTIVNPADLLVGLAEVRERGYAVENLENSLDLRSLASPVFDHAGAVCAAVGISAPASRLLMESLAEPAAHVVHAAAAISASLGFDQRRHIGRDADTSQGTSPEDVFEMTPSAVLHRKSTNSDVGRDV